MGTPYTRQSSFSNGDVIDAELFNPEFDQLVTSFDSASGHTHDGTAGEGGAIPSIAVTFDNTASGLAATDLQAAVDEIEARLEIEEGLTAGGAVVSVNGNTGIVVLTATDFGLGNVDNTSDANKPVSTATQTELDTKSDATATQAALDLKADAAATQSALDLKLDAIGGTLTNYAETTDTSAVSSLNFTNGNVHSRVLTSPITFTIDNAPVTGSSKLELLLVNGSTHAVTWPSVTWVGGFAPTLTAKDLIVFSKYEGDATIYALWAGGLV